MDVASTSSRASSVARQAVASEERRAVQVLGVLKYAAKLAMSRPCQADGVVPGEPVGLARSALLDFVGVSPRPQPTADVADVHGGPDSLHGAQRMATTGRSRLGPDDLPLSGTSRLVSRRRPRALHQEELRCDRGVRWPGRGLPVRRDLQMRLGNPRVVCGYLLCPDHSSARAGPARRGRLTASPVDSGGGIKAMDLRFLDQHSSDLRLYGWAILGSNQ